MNSKSNHLGLALAFLALWLPTSVEAKQIDGFTRPFETVNLAAPEGGIIESLDVRQGTRVTQGQLIAILDSGVLRASLESARAKAESQGRVMAAEAACRQRKSRFHHLQQLYKDGHASSEELERAEADADIAKANLVTAREDARAGELEVKRIEAQLQRRTIRSPIAGVITHIAKRPGEFVTATDATIATIVQTDRLRVTFHLPTEQIASLRGREQVGIHFVSERQDASAVIDFVSPITDAESNLVRVEVVIDNAQGRFRSGVRCVLTDQGQAAPSADHARQLTPNKQPWLDIGSVVLHRRS